MLYHSPTSEQILRFWHEVTAALAEPIRRGVYRKNETLHMIELPGTEQCIRAKTAWEPDHLRGDYGSVILLDEYQLMSERCWSEVIAPMTLDRNARVVFAMTPPSLRTLYTSKASDPRHATKLFQQAQADTSGRWEAFYFTSFENPHLSRDALADITKDMSVRAYQQEIMALDATDVEGALWSQDLLTVPASLPTRSPTSPGRDCPGPGRHVPSDVGRNGHCGGWTWGRWPRLPPPGCLTTRHAGSLCTRRHSAVRSGWRPTCSSVKRTTAASGSVR